MSTSGRTATMRQGSGLLGWVEPEGERRRYTCDCGRSVSRGDVAFDFVRGWVTFDMNCWVRTRFCWSVYACSMTW